MAMNENDPVATGKCKFEKCGAKVNYRVSKNGLVSYTCHGEYDVKACRQHFRMGKMESREFLQKIEQLREGAANDNAAEKPARTGTSDEGGWSL